jgi:signal transduction histidine kinase
MTTLRWRLTRTVLSLVLPLWVLIGSVAYWSVLHELDEIYDAQVRDVARPLQELSTPELMAYVQRAQDAAHAVSDQIDFGVMVWDEDGGLLYRSPEAPSLSYGDRPRKDSLASAGVSGEALHHRVRWLHQAPQKRWLAVSVSLHERDELALAMGVGLALPLVLTGVLMWPLMWWGVSRALAPVRELVASVGRRAGHDLSPIDVPGLPRDIEPLAHEVNALLERLQDALTREQRFTADASHELRTPLAGAAAQLEVAQASQTEPERQRALLKAGQALQRASELASQLMFLARLDHHSGGAVPVPGWRHDIDLLPLVREVVADEFEAAHQRGVGLALECAGPLPLLAGQPLWLSTAVRNLVHNAVGHAPPSSDVVVRLFSRDGAVLVAVADQGPGLPDALRDQVGRRFARGPESQTRAGTGLGLSIVRRVLDLHGGDWAFSEGPGLTATLSLPVAQGLRRP